MLESSPTDDDDDDDSSESTKPPVEWGVSFIGGDPCGSKYNNDPFDKQVQKPGMPDDMKARIAAGAARRLQKEAEEKENEE